RGEGELPEGGVIRMGGFGLVAGSRRGLLLDLVPIRCSAGQAGNHTTLPGGAEKTAGGAGAVW
ncbi:MAG TPA: hypothetical protein VFP10_13550, partial [Candidatus Eisenbacteria bacterium]|nr:hypothetical protein [Candidatus Eisenbacteria bacterium]